MSKLIVAQVLEKARYDVNRVANEAKLPPQFKRISDAFQNNPNLQNQEGLADLCGLITGYRPRAMFSKIAPFQVFAVMSKAEQRVTKFAICMIASSGSAYGCSSLSENNVPFTVDTCRLATPEEATAFIESEVASWEDNALLTWINAKLGSNYFQVFFNELERTIPTEVTDRKAR